MSIVELEREIETLRAQLEELISRTNGRLVSGNILSTSKRLDILINYYNKLAATIGDRE